MRKISLTYCVILFIFSCGFLQAQPYLFDNPSFEGVPGASLLPESWKNCGEEGQTPPDTHPANAFNVFKTPHHGNTYIGMVMRDDWTYEAIGQRLPVTLEPGQCYKFNIHLARSEEYLSPSLLLNKLIPVQFTEPILLRVWGGYNICDRKEMLFETKLIEHTGWRQYEIRLKPNQKINYVVLEAFCKTPIINPIRGNILMDNLSSIVSCNERIPKVEPFVPDTPPKTPPKPIVKATPPPKPPAKKQEPVVKAEPETLNLDNKEIKKGDIINVKNLLFKPDSLNPVAESYKVMNEIYRYLRDNRNVKIEVRGHTNGVPSHEFCDKLSTQRAQSVANYLIGKGIGRDRIIAKGYGKREPIASNDSKEGRAKNQRVEIKILSTNN